VLPRPLDARVFGQVRFNERSFRVGEANSFLPPRPPSTSEALLIGRGVSVFNITDDASRARRAGCLTNESGIDEFCVRLIVLKVLC
jgi:hypothetical protein